MRAPALLLPLLVALLACKSDTGEDTGESSSGELCELPEADASYPPCDCDHHCEGDSLCRFSQLSSVCLPSCTLGPSCKNPDDPCNDSDCPPLAGITATCYGGVCTIGCGPGKPCPTGYVCADAGHCQVEL